MPLGLEGRGGASTALCGGCLTEALTKAEINPTRDVRKVKGWIYQKKRQMTSGKTDAQRT